MTDKPIINLIKWDENTDGKLCDANMAKKLQIMGYHSIKYTFPPGTDFPDHAHNVTKMDAITSGQFFISMHGQNRVLQPGDIVEVPRQVVHNAHVIGSDSVTFFDSTKYM
ncbi:nicotinic acetylcholine receptor subunit alpha 8 [Elysia marginata]|uniref:Nicotinic acetylcholine receptor subunit alpha 8 n=1 Tax=Elysia marginata TaxID=1093978 RepID=A0AAV4HJH0_9GAST|nr:nicotinic acetylcholine receptor subunit alpha 8 [Elysia marginata]